MSTLDGLVAAAERELEAALRGASLCSVSRDPSHGATTVKYLEGRWYTLRAIQRRVAESHEKPEAAIGDVRADLARRTPDGTAWIDYRRGSEAGLADAIALLTP